MGFSNLVSSLVGTAFNIAGDVKEEAIITSIDARGYDFATQSAIITENSEDITVQCIVSDRNLNRRFRGEKDTANVFYDLEITFERDESINLDGYNKVSLRDRSWDIIRTEDSPYIQRLYLVRSK